MTTMTHDTRPVAPTPAPRTGPDASRVGAGLAFAVVSAFSFGLSGALAKGLVESGWSSAAAVTLRVTIASLVLLVPALVSLRGRWHLLAANVGLITGYGLAAVAGCQLFYFYAVEHLQVGVALLIEYIAPVVVIAWMWLRHGHRPGRLTLVGSGVAVAGLVLVLDLFSGADLSLVGIGWALLAMAGAAVYFIASASEDNGLPPIVLAASGLSLGAVSLAVAGFAGLVQMTFSTADVTYGDAQVPFWLPLLGLGVVTAAVAYTTGIAAGRRLGSRMASFAALLEVVAAMLFAWLLLGELPQTVQFLGGALILAGVVVVKLGERDTATPTESVITPV